MKKKALVNGGSTLHDASGEMYARESSTTFTLRVTLDVGFKIYQVFGPRYVGIPRACSVKENHSIFSTYHSWYGDEAPAHIRSIHGHYGNLVVRAKWLTQVKFRQSFTKAIFDTDF